MSPNWPPRGSSLKNVRLSEATGRFAQAAWRLLGGARQRARRRRPVRDSSSRVIVSVWRRYARRSAGRRKAPAAAAATLSVCAPPPSVQYNFNLILQRGGFGPSKFAARERRKRQSDWLGGGGGGAQTRVAAACVRLTFRRGAISADTILLFARILIAVLELRRRRRPAERAAARARLGRRSINRARRFLCARAGGACAQRPPRAATRSSSPAQN